MTQAGVTELGRFHGPSTRTRATNDVQSAGRSCRNRRPRAASRPLALPAFVNGKSRASQKAAVAEPPAGDQDPAPVVRVRVDAGHQREPHAVRPEPGIQAGVHVGWPDPGGANTARLLVQADGSDPPGGPVADGRPVDGATPWAGPGRPGARDIVFPRASAVDMTGVARREGASIEARHHHCDECRARWCHEGSGGGPDQHVAHKFGLRSGCRKKTQPGQRTASGAPRLVRQSPSGTVLLLRRVPRAHCLR